MCTTGLLVPANMKPGATKLFKITPERKFPKQAENLKALVISDLYLFYVLITQEDDILKVFNSIDLSVGIWNRYSTYYFLSIELLAYLELE